MVGTFYFKSASIYNNLYDSLIKNDIRVNGEFYVDSLVDIALKKNLKVQYFNVNKYISWGTPNDYRTFSYWQEYFHKTPTHPYNAIVDLFCNLNNEDFRKKVNKYL